MDAILWPPLCVRRKKTIRETEREKEGEGGKRIVLREAR